MTGLLAMVSLFFLWGFVASSNPVLIPAVKSVFGLSQTQAMFVDIAFYLAYGLGGAAVYLMSRAGFRLIEKLGSKRSLLLGLTLAAAGGFGFFPAAEFKSYFLMLSSLMCMGLGFSILQIVANPYLIALGEEAFAAQRINLAGAMNSLGTTIGPLLMGKMIFASGISGLDEIGMAYAGLGLFFSLLSIALYFIPLPEISIEKSQDEVSEKSPLLKPAFLLGLLALFIYVGTEVSISSNLAMLLEQPEFLYQKADETVVYTSLYWASLMMGRWIGAVAVLNFSKPFDLIAKIAAPFFAFVLALFCMMLNDQKTETLADLLPFALLIPPVLLLPYFLGKEKPGRTMFLLSLSGFIVLILGMLFKGKTGALLIVSAGLCCSVLWSCIFALAVRGLGKATHQGSSLLIVMITGGAVVPPLQAEIMERGWITESYIVPAAGFLCMALYPLLVQGKKSAPLN